MTAMHRETGKGIGGVEELEQSLDEILATQRGDRVMRADYGTELLELVDVGMDASGKARLSQATAEAIMRHEPRVRVSRVVARAEAGAVTFEVQAEATRGAGRVVARRSL